MRTVPAAELEELRELTREVLPETIELRHMLHTMPERGMEETRTAETVRAALGRTRLEILPPLIGTDTVGLLRGGVEGRCVLLRADIDALPVEDRSGAEWASRNPGFSHACGHDGHAAMLYGAVRVLERLADRLRGSVRFVFQPAEEKLGGGKRLVEKGLLEIDPVPAAAFALHGWPGLPVGTLSASAGRCMAAADRFVVTIRGRGGHGARPHATVDPVVTAAQAILALQTIVSRRIDPVRPVVVSVCTLSGGVADNAIPDEVVMTGTTRYFDAEMMPAIRDRIEQIVSGVCAAAGASFELEYSPGYVPLVNDPEMTDFAASVIRAYLGEEVWAGSLPVTMGAEDFAFYLEKVPGAMLRLGLGEDHAGLHESGFDFADEAMERGILALTALALETLAAESLPKGRAG